MVSARPADLRLFTTTMAGVGLLLLALPSFAFASSLVWGESGGTPAQIEIFDGGTYGVPLNTPAPGHVNFSPDIQDIVVANLYRVDSSDPSNPSYEFIANVFHPDFAPEVTFAWPSAGSYVVEITFLPVLSFQDRIKSFIARLLFAEVAYAQFDGPIETIHFTIEEAGSCSSDCFSNVLFLPGLEASRLYDTDGDRLWEPPFFGLDHEKLLLDHGGVPVHPGIYTKDVIDEAFTENIYKSFMGEMDGLVVDGTINAWNDFPYDWRFDVNDIVNDPTALATTTISLIAEVDRLAASSKSGKVTIISHSNGGLVGKVLLSELANQGKANLVDKFIMVAVPQIGTPKTIATLLHGEAMPSEWFPFVAQAREIREIGENMPSGYTLLPSLEYFARVLDPVVEFDTGSALTQPFVDRYGLAITNASEFTDFLLGAEGRVKPATSDVLHPNILNAGLLAQGGANHTALDAWQAPTGIDVIQIVGWGVPTIRGLRYFENDSSLDHGPLITVDGDGTVVVPSADAMNVSQYFINLSTYNKDWHFNRAHASIFEVGPLQELLTGIIINDVITPEHVTGDTPESGLEGSPSIRLKVHSPVSVDLYDESGRHTGVATSTVFGIPMIQGQIPNSYYFEIGEGKYAGADVLGTTTVRLNGLALGTFTLDIEQTIGDTITASTTFTDIPVTASTTAVLDIFASTTLGSSQLVVDVDGDGTPDAEISIGEGLTVSELLGLLRGLVQSFDLPAKKEKKLLKAIDKLEKQILKEQEGKKFQKHEIRNALKEIKGKVKFFEKKKLLTKDEVKELLDILEKIENLVIK